MSIAKTPSKVSLPQHNVGVATVLEYMIGKFQGVSASIWRQRMIDGKVHWHDGSLITPQCEIRPQQRVYYYREVEAELVIPFQETVLYQDDHILVAFKPHFLPVVPGGRYVTQCMQHRLQQLTGIKTLQAVHRLDRVTAGLVLFSLRPESRGVYHDLFKNHKISKTYQAIARVDSDEKIVGREWSVSNLLVKSTQNFRMQIIDGKPNSHSHIRGVAQSGDRGLFELKPITGKTHQLRLHMASLGYPIEFDKYYPELQDLAPDEYSRPLQLLAKSLRFIDPITGQNREYSCSASLSLD